MTQRWPDLAGRLEPTTDGLQHILPVRVYFEDTDFSGVVYHGSYVRWCERGRSDFLRLLGNNHGALLEDDENNEAAAFVVRRMSLDFHRPARIDNILEVCTRICEIRAASLTLDQEICDESGKVFDARVLVVLLGLSGKPQRLSRRLRSAMSRAADSVATQ
ncbi:MAG: YbgC/FadM family acyl-CoA thioesterase [Hyphomicrobiaceae bacterium]